jgi:hypothetical protein
MTQPQRWQFDSDAAYKKAISAKDSTKVRFRQSLREVAVLKTSQYFGELALLQNDVRAATVTAGSNEVVVVQIPRECFTKVGGPKGFVGNVPLLSPPPSLSFLHPFGGRTTFLSFYISFFSFFAAVVNSKMPFLSIRKMNACRHEKVHSSHVSGGKGG